MARVMAWWSHAFSRAIGSQSGEAFARARLEVTFALLRATGTVFTVVALLGHAPRTSSGRSVDLTMPIALNTAGFVGSVLVAVAARSMRRAESLRRLGVAVCTADLLFFCLYSVAYHDIRGAGSFVGLLVLIEGAVRFGVPGAAVTAVAVATTAIIWPQVDAGGYHQGPVEVVVLCAIFSGATVLVTQFVRRTSATLRAAQEQFQSAFKHASIGMAVVDADGVLVEVNRSLGRIVGVAPSSLVGTAAVDLVHPDDRDAVLAAIAGAQSGGGHRLHARLVHGSGEPRWGLVACSRLSNGPGQRAQAVLQVEDVTDRRRFEEQLAYQAGHDALTGLPNRHQLIERLAQALGEPVTSAAVLFVDLDRFKVVNDARGHSAGDELLVQVAHRLADLVRPGDVVARLGGDEFVVLCHDVAAVSDVRAVAQRIIEVIRRPFVIDGERFFVDASVGIAVPGPDDTPETLLRDADTAMYLAKQSGGGQCEVFAPSMRAAALRRHELEDAMRTALERREFELYYQPSVDLRTGEVCAVEALLRWRHPVRGFLPPGEFVPVAEETDLIVDIGAWVLREAMEQSVRWSDVLPAGRRPEIGVNVSRRQLARVGFVDTVAALLTETSAAPSSICLEITETALAGSVEPIVDVLQSLRRLGVRLAIDDFGTGHASLTYLSRFPVDILKIDRSFITGLGKGAGSEAIVSSVNAMSHAFGLTVIAEGVETDEQLRILREVGCDIAQGYLFARPMPIADATEFVLVRAAPDIPAQRDRYDSPETDRRARPRRRASTEAGQRYRLLLDLARDVTGCLDLETVLDRSFIALRQITHFTGGSIQLIDDSGLIGIAAAVPTPTAEAVAMRIPVGQGIAGGIAATGEPRYLPDITADRAVTAARRTRSTSGGVRSYFGVPLITEGRVTGVLQIDSVEVDAWDEDNRLLVLAFAPIVAAAVQNARLFEREVASVMRMRSASADGGGQ